MYRQFPNGIVLAVKHLDKLWSLTLITLEDEEFDDQFILDEFYHQYSVAKKGCRRLTISNQCIPIVTLKISSYLASCFHKELVISKVYRKCVWRHLVESWQNINYSAIFAQIELIFPNKQILDYKFCTMAQYQIHERIELDYIMSWLSTLGGAFSSLGDQFVNCAVTAGRISAQQFKIALRLGDPATLQRCQLYLSISLIQQNRFKSARRIISHIYKQAVQQPADAQDKKIISMCLGIWAKLKYSQMEYFQTNGCISTKDN